MMQVLVLKGRAWGWSWLSRHLEHPAAADARELKPHPAHPIVAAMQSWEPRQHPLAVAVRQALEAGR